MGNHGVLTIESIKLERTAPAKYRASCVLGPILFSHVAAAPLRAQVGLLQKVRLRLPDIQLSTKLQKLLKKGG